jgi:hypothetical protein
MKTKYLPVFAVVILGMVVALSVSQRAESTTKISSGMIQAYKATSSTYARSLEDRAADAAHPGADLLKARHFTHAGLTTLALVHQIIYAVYLE